MARVAHFWRAAPTAVAAVIALLIAPPARATDDAAHALAQKFAGASDDSAATKKAEDGSAAVKTPETAVTKKPDGSGLSPLRHKPKTNTEEARRKAEEAEMLKQARKEAGERAATARKAEAEREAEDARTAAEARARQEAEAQRVAEEKRRAEEDRLAAEARAKQEAEDQRIAEEKRRAEEDRLAAEARAKQEAEDQRVAEEKRRTEEDRLAAEARAKQEAEDQRIAEEKRRAEEDRLAAEARAKQEAEDQHIAEEKRHADEDRLAAEVRAKQEAEDQRVAEEKRHAEEDRLAAETRAKQEAEDKRLDEERLRALEAQREEEGRRLTERLTKMEEARTKETAGKAPETTPEIGLGANSGHDAPPTFVSPHVADSEPGSVLPSRVTILLVMDPGTTGIRRFGQKTADPVVCAGQSCWVSAGPDKDAEAMARGKALGPINTLGRRAAACNHSLGCVFRGVELGSAPIALQPIDLRIMHHDRREPLTIATASTCEAHGQQLHCATLYHAKDWRAWIVPEDLAQRVGPEALKEVIDGGLPVPRAANLEATSVER